MSKLFVYPPPLSLTEQQEKEIDGMGIKLKIPPPQHLQVWGGETFFIIISRQAKVEIKFPAWICQNILGGSVFHEIVDIETEFDNSLTYLSWAHMGSNREKNRVRKFRDTLPLRKYGPLFMKYVVATSVACQTAVSNGSWFESCISHRAPTLLM